MTTTLYQPIHAVPSNEYFPSQLSRTLLLFHALDLFGLLSRLLWLLLSK